MEVDTGCQKTTSWPIEVPTGKCVVRLFLLSQTIRLPFKGTSRGLNGYFLPYLMPPIVPLTYSNWATSPRVNGWLWPI